MLWFVLLALAMPAQTQKKAVRPPADAAFPLTSLDIKGNKIYSADKIRAAAGLAMGQPVDRPRFEAARERLLKTGAFEEVSYSFGPDAAGKGIAGIVSVVEVEQLYPFRFEDLPAGDRDIRAYLLKREPLFENRIPGTREMLAHLSGEIQEFVAARGFKDKVTGRIMATGPGELAVVFRPATPAPNIGEVKFTGNQVVSSAALNNTFGLVAIGTPFNEERVRQLLESSVRPLYEEKGRLEVKFGKIDVRRMETVDGVAIAVAVEEGPEYKLGEVTASGSALPARDLVKAADLKTGERVNFTEVQAAVVRVQGVLRKEGFMRSETEVKRSVNAKERTVGVEFVSKDGPRFYMGKLAIEGLDVTTEPAIRKLWSMTPGKVFNPEYPQFFLDRVKEDGYLDNLGRTWFDEAVDEKNLTVDVVLHFTGAPPELERKKKRPEGPGPGSSFPALVSCNKCNAANSFPPPQEPQQRPFTRTR